MALDHYIKNPLELHRLGNLRWQTIEKESTPDALFQAKDMNLSAKLMLYNIKTPTVILNIIDLEYLVSFCSKPDIQYDWILSSRQNPHAKSPVGEAKATM